jgi:hypothetical protein
MKNPTEKKSPTTPKQPIPDNRGLDPREPLFTPPAKPAVKEQKGPDKRDEEVVKDGSEFEIVKIEEMPADPHEHGVSAPTTQDENGAVPII